MIKKHKLFVVITFLTLTSCDPMDDRMVFINNDTQNIHVDMVFFRDSIKSDFFHVRAGNRVISAQDTQRLGMTTFWENEFESGKPDSLLRVIVIPESKLRYPDSLEYWQTLVGSGYCFLKSYSYRELEKKDWTVIFPDDGFEVKK